MISTDIFNRFDAEDDSTLICKCGSSFTWSGFDRGLQPWMEKHAPHTGRMPQPAKPWEEEWRAFGRYVNLQGGVPRAILVADGVVATEENVARARLASAAPELVRALLAVEWEGDESHEMYAVCPCCRGINPTHARRWTLDEETEALVDHRSSCTLDSALDRAGLPRESRYAARAALGLTSPRAAERSR